MKPDWRTVPCHSCGGHGVVSVYSAFDFEGAGECRDCNGGGRVFIRPSGHLFLWPGGPAAGRTSPGEYERATPVEFETSRSGGGVLLCHST